MFDCYLIFSCNYRTQTKFAKVMFLHLSVSHSVHGGAGPRGVPGPGGCLVKGGVPGPVPGPGGCLVKGVYLVPGCLLGEGAWWRPPTAVGGTHPTGMHSCLHKSTAQLQVRSNVALRLTMTIKNLLSTTGNANITLTSDK